MGDISQIHKLFRDKLVSQQKAMGRTILGSRYTGKQLIDALYNKLEEELVELKQLLTDEKEYLQSELETLKKKIMSEAKDAQEVIDSLLFHGESRGSLQMQQEVIDKIGKKFQISKEELAEAQRADNADRGSFKEGRYVKQLQIPEGAKRYDYFKNKYEQTDSWDEKPGDIRF